MRFIWRASLQRSSRVGRSDRLFSRDLLVRAAGSLRGARMLLGRALRGADSVAGETQPSHHGCAQATVAEPHAPYLLNSDGSARPLV